MKCTYLWLKEFVPFDYTPAELAEKLTLLGLEVDGYETVRRNLKDALVGKIVDRTNSGALRVDVGDEIIDIADQGHLPADRQMVVILKTDNKNEIATYRMLQISDDESAIFIEDQTEAGVKISEIIPEEDVVYDIDLTPNRPDCLSILGIARELATLTGNTLKLPETKVAEVDDAASDYIRVSIETKNGCPRYAARVIREISIQPSPLWIHDRLAKVGLRAINNVVDATNYVMQELGHPLHAFDYQLIRNREIRVRLSEPGEYFITLDEKGHTLDDKTVLICDGKRAVAIGGIMGGLNSEVNVATKDILLECAYFNPAFIRRSSRKLNLVTDASMRFSRGMDANGIEMVINRTAGLIGVTSQGKILRGIVDQYVAPVVPKTIQLRSKRVGQVLGVQITTRQIRDIMTNLGCLVTTAVEADEDLTVTVPTYRPDLEREIDLIEEVGRIIGYDKIPEKTETTLQLSPAINRKEKYLKNIREFWVGNGFNESVSSSMIPLSDVSLEFYSSETIKIKNPLSEDMAVLRPSLIPSLMRIAQYNLFRRQQNIRFFEIGSNFLHHGDTHEEQLMLTGILSGNTMTNHWSHQSEKVTFFDLKGVLTNFFKKFGISNYQFKDMQTWALEEPCVQILIDSRTVGIAGQVKQNILDRYDISSECFIFELTLDKFLPKIKRERLLTPIPRYPSVQRDLAFIIELDIPGGKVLEEIAKWGGIYLKDLEIFDIYTGKQVPVGKKSVAVSMNFQAENKTLTESEINEMVEKIITHVKDSLKAELRS